MLSYWSRMLSLLTFTIGCCIALIGCSSSTSSHERPIVSPTQSVFTPTPVSTDPSMPTVISYPPPTPTPTPTKPVSTDPSMPTVISYPPPTPKPTPTPKQPPKT